MSELNTTNGCTTEVASCKNERVSFSPGFDFVETPDEFRLYGDLPGVGPDAVEIELEKGELSIRGKVARSGDQTYLRKEYGVGDYQRKFSVGESVDPEAISAEMHHGVLTIRLPKREPLRPRQIEVSG